MSQRGPRNQSSRERIGIISAPSPVSPRLKPRPSGAEQDIGWRWARTYARRLLRRLHPEIDESAGLTPPQGGLVAAVAQELVVRALLNDVAAVEYDQTIHARATQLRVLAAR